MCNNLRQADLQHMLALNKPTGKGESRNYDFQHVIIKTSKFYAPAIMHYKRRGFLRNKF